MYRPVDFKAPTLRQAANASRPAENDARAYARALYVIRLIMIRRGLPAQAPPPYYKRFEL